uniref:protein-synthesizing GTPase n=1 Tax=Lotharella vacuolata TaxID=74820 RepID=A0A0H5BH40_9EUKA|nr:eukaryotic translation initiation factor gamma SU [Lotharella vacuolata]
MFKILITPKIFFTNDKLKNIKQSLINVGTLGHVSHGKTFFIKQLTTKNTNKFTDEEKRGISIKLGYTNCSIFKVKKKKIKFLLKSFSKHIKNDTPTFRFSFIDCPGHKMLLTTMLTGASLMDSILFFVSVNDLFPQEQTIEHLLSLNVYKFSKLIIILSKVDLGSFMKILYIYLVSNSFFKKKNIKNKIFLNTCFFNINLNFISYEIMKLNSCVFRKINNHTLFVIIRVFNTKDKKKVIGGTLIQGFLQKGIVAEIKPGISENKLLKHKKILTKIVEIRDNETILNFVIPGGLIGLLTEIDTDSNCNNNFIGHFIGLPGKMPKIYKKILIKYYIFRNFKKLLINEFNEEGLFPSKTIITVNSANIIGSIKKMNRKYMLIFLDEQTCILKYQKIIISTKSGNNWSLLAWGKFIQGE